MSDTNLKFQKNDFRKIDNLDFDFSENHGFRKSKKQSNIFDFRKIMIFEKSKIRILDFSKIRKFWNFKFVFEIWPTLKCCNFFAIESILKIWDVSESSGSLLSHCCISPRVPSGKPLARLQTRSRWDWVMRDVRWVWIRFRRILSLSAPKSTRISSKIVRYLQNEGYTHYKNFKSFWYVSPLGIPVR